MLIICIDRDDDLGKKAKVKGPIIGKKACINAAASLGMADPADSDINAIFAAVKEYDEIRKEAVPCEVCVLTGNRNRGYKADKEIAKQLEAVIAKFDTKEVIFVSDGADDEQVLPIIESRVKISSVKTIIVKQTKELEKS